MDSALNKYLGYFNDEEIVAAFESEHIRGVFRYVLYTAPRPDAQDRSRVAPHAMVDMHTAQSEDAEAWLRSGAIRAAVALEAYAHKNAGMGLEYRAFLNAIADYASMIHIAAYRRQPIGNEDFGKCADPMLPIHAVTFYTHLKDEVYWAMYLSDLGIDPAKPHVPEELANHGSTLSDPIEV
jgi:hypothetical protein